MVFSAQFTTFYTISLLCPGNMVKIGFFHDGSGMPIPAPRTIVFMSMIKP